MSTFHSRYPDGIWLYDDLRKKWEHEDSLINQRVTWLLTFQAFLFAAYGVVAKLRIDHDAVVWKKMHSHFWSAFSPYSFAEVLLVASGCIIMLFISKGILAAIRAMDSIKKQFRTHKKAGRIWPRAKIDVLHNTTEDGASPARIMAIASLRIWYLLAGYEVIRIIIPFFWSTASIM